MSELAVARPPRDVVTVIGADALTYLQGQLSQDLDGLGDGDAVHTLLLTPQGKLEVELALVRVGADEAWLACEGGFGDRLVEGLNRFKIRVDAELALRSDRSVLAVRGIEPRAWPSVRVLPARWVGPAFDLVGEEAALDAVERELVDAGAEDWSPDEYEARRVAAGVPRLGLDLGEKTIPQEAFLERDAVSFEKGCFLGQELVCRIDTRGHVNRYLRVLRDVAAADGMPRGAEIATAEKVVGSVTSVAGSSALGYVRREVEPPAEVTLRWDGGEATATAVEPPFLGAAPPS
jgi:folate-binding protein YgfZ